MRFPRWNRSILSLTVIALAIPFSSCGSNSSSTSAHNSYVTVPQSNHVVVLHIDDTSGNLSAISGSPFAAGDSPSGIAVTPSKQFAYVANSNDNDISLFTIDSGNGSLTEVMPRTTAGTNPVALAIDSTGNFLIAANQGSNNVSVFSIASGGKLSEVAGSPFAVGSGPTHLVATHSGSLYVANTNSLSISAFTITSGTGFLMKIGTPVALSQAPLDLALDPAEHFLYAALPAGFTGFSIDQVTGGLTEITVTPFTAGTIPASLAVSPSGQFLYVANLGSNNVSVFSLDATTGQPTQITNSPFAAGTRPAFVTIDPSGNFVYTGDQGSKSISILKVNTSTGELGTGTTFTTEDAAAAMVIPK
jgi:6-phosphogluconolactonase (cycloisomerase 2 family)